mgnify:CR=1 FL=1
MVITRSHTTKQVEGQLRGAKDKKKEKKKLYAKKLKKNPLSKTFTA